MNQRDLLDQAGRYLAGGGLGLRWALELVRRGLLVNPNEKFYISLAHTDADIDRTLGIVDEAFAAIAP